MSDTIKGTKISEIDVKHSLRDLIVFIDRDDTDPKPESYFVISYNDLLSLLQKIDYLVVERRKNIHLKPII